MSRQPIELPRSRKTGNVPWRYRQVARRRSEAEERQSARKARGDAGQLARLDAMFGEGQGAQRERARLAARIFNTTGMKLPPADGNAFEKAA